ncbi:MAG: carboxypeptidase-like regulatory domain-containing protein, partial [Acidobacteriota bacterium]
SQPPPAFSPGPVVPAAPQAPRLLTGRLDIGVGNADVLGLVMRLSTGAEITGRITVEGGMDLATFAQGSVQANRVGVAPVAFAGRVGEIAAVPGAVLGAVAVPQQQYGRVILTSADSQQNGTTGIAGADGTFRITGVAAAKYMMSMNPMPPGAYVKSIRYGGQDITNALLDASSGAGGVLDIVLSPKAATLSGTARDGSGQALPSRTTIVIWPRTPRVSDPNGGVLTLTTRDEMGTFTAQGVTPGEYYVAVLQSAAQDFMRAPEYLARFNQTATMVSLREGETTTVEPKYVPKDVVEKATAQFP